MNTREEEPTQSRPPFYKRHKWLLMGLLGYLISQSITFSMPIRGRIVSEDGKPIAGAEIAAIWSIQVFGFVDMGPAGAVHIAHARSDEEGRYKVPATLVVHTPMFPFSLLMRTDDMPELVVVAKGYRPALEGNDEFGINGPPHAGGFWFLRESSLRGRDIKLTALLDLVRDGNGRDADSKLSMADRAITQAVGSCRRRWACRLAPLAAAVAAIRADENEIRKHLTH